MLVVSTKKRQSQHKWLLLMLWIVIGAGLRLINLDAKLPWTDEFATLVLSLGNSFKSIPLDRIVSFQNLVSILIPHPTATASDVVQGVFTEDHHPPTYFALAHLWMKLFPTDDGLVNLWAARALPALFGILTIPIIYICSYLIFRSAIIANLTAAMVAVSPYGVAISQEARQYSLAIIWATIALTCLVMACKYLAKQQKLPIPLVMTWIIANNLGIATHYFFSFFLATTALTIGLFLWLQIRQLDMQKSRRGAYYETPLDILTHPSWRRLYLVGLGTAVGVIYWFWLLSRSYDPTMSRWMNISPNSIGEILTPLSQTIGVLMRMVSILFAEATPQAIGMIARVMMVIFFIWAIPMLISSIREQWSQPHRHLPTMITASFAALAIGLYLVIPWLTGKDITRGSRYHFVYFPAMMLLVGVALAICWRSYPSLARWVSGKQAVAIVLLMGFVGSLVVTMNYSYQKYYRSDLASGLLQQSTPTPVLIATTHNSLVQIGEIMGIAWEMRHTPVAKQAQFLFAHQAEIICTKNCQTTTILRQNIDRISHPIDLWTINFYAPISLPPTCQQNTKFKGDVGGYEYKLYHCKPNRVRLSE
jgi:uncharacterized membrane protein